MHVASLLFLWVLAPLVSSQPGCQYPEYTCPTANYSVCEGTSLQGPIILRCVKGCATAGNCNDNLAGVPPFGVKTNALCWQTSNMTGDAQCTIDCVNVTAANGSTFYPVGCSFSQTTVTAAPSSTSLSLFQSSTATSTAPMTTSSKGYAVQQAVGFGGIVAIGMLPLLV